MPEAGAFDFCNRMSRRPLSQRLKEYVIKSRVENFTFYGSIVRHFPLQVAALEPSFCQDLSQPGFYCRVGGLPGQAYPVGADTHRSSPYPYTTGAEPKRFPRANSLAHCREAHPGGLSWGGTLIALPLRPVFDG